ncbi:cytochrome P450 [Diaporthe sp. PMI_573]|nr:cytochrome P450 [Diaporthaceae sp. PMI_573]
MEIFTADSVAAKLLAVLIKMWPFVLIIAVASAAVWLFQSFSKQDPVSKIPLVGDDIEDEGTRRMRFAKGAKHVYQEGYRKFKNGLFRVSSPRESTVIVVSPHFLKELSALPDDQLSFHGALKEKMQSRFTHITVDIPVVPHIVRNELTPALSRLNPIIAEEVAMAFQDELPPCKEFTRVPINRALWRIVAKVSGRFFVGAELARSEEYMDMSINYTLEIAGAVKGIAAIKPDEREAKAPSLPQLLQLQNRRKRTLEFIRPLIAARKKAMAEDIDYQPPDDMIQWILNGETKYGKLSVEDLAELQLFLIFAAIHTTTMTTINAFYTLAAMPEIVPEIRDEIRAVLMEHGTFSTPALQKMEKLDSFLREVMRVYPLSWSTFQRKVHKPITLSNGQFIPAGAILEIPAHSIVHDPERFDRPDEFDAFRHYRAHHEASLGAEKKAGSGAANQMVSTSLNNLPFGYGRLACPGRFFASNEIKMIVARAILDYDIQLADGATERYPNIEYNEANIPDPSKELMFKRIPI